MEEPYKQRPNDHLVEPFLGGLGVEEEVDPKALETHSDVQPAQVSWWRSWLKKLGLRGD